MSKQATRQQANRSRNGSRGADQRTSSGSRSGRSAPRTETRGAAGVERPPTLLGELLGADRHEVVAPAALWRTVAALVLALAGLGVSIYLTIAHYVGTQALVCSDSGVINCAKVTTSAQSHFLGIPVAVLGLAYYLVMSGLNLPPAWRSSDWRVHALRLALSVVGILFALYLVAAELLIIGNICIWCTSVHVVTFLLFVLVLSTVPAMLGWGGRAGDRYSSA